MKKTIKSVLALTLPLVFAGSASANLIENGGFENNQLGGGWSVFSSIDDGDSATNNWTTVSGAGIELQRGGTGGLRAHSGQYKVELDSHNGNGGAYGVSTNTVMAQLVEGLTFGDLYELTFWYAARPGTGDNTNGISAYASDNVNLMANPGALGSVANNTTTWQEISYVFSATAESMYVGFGADGTANTLGGYLDDVSLVSVPEPGSLVLLALGLVGLGAARRKAK